MIRKACSFDVAAIVDLAKKVWLQNTEEELAEETLSLIKSKNSTIFLAADESVLVGFAHCIAKKSIGFDSKKRTHVAFLEAVYVKPEYSHQGIATELTEKCLEWAKDNKCTEIYSEFETNDTALIGFHKRMGFIHAENVVRYIKKL